jgi:Transposase DDE domain
MILRSRQPPQPSAFALEALARLPLAEAVLSLWGYALQPDFLEGVFDRHRGRTFTEVLTFPTVVELLGDALVRHRGSGRASFRRAAERGALPTSAEAVYGKLRRLPLGLSLGFLEEVTARLLPLLPPGARAARLPACLAGLTVVIADGKTIKRVARRLLPSRGAAGKIYGGKLLVAFLPACGLVTTFAADRDGEANEARLVPALLARADGRIPGPRLWVLDRQFCDPVQAGRLTAAGDHFLIRHHRKVHFVPDPERPGRRSKDAQGREVLDEWGWLGAASNRLRRYVRRLTVRRPSGQEAVAVVTDLLDGEAYPAADLLELYRQRWGIEQVFQQITEVFALGRLIGRTPEATVFQAAFCLVLYNLIQVVRHYVAAARACAAAALSAEQLYGDVQEQLTGLFAVAPAAEVAACLPAAWTAEALAARLGQLLGRVWSPRWRKAVNKKPRPHQIKPKGGDHTSVHRLQEAHREKRLSTDPKT